MYAQRDLFAQAAYLSRELHWSLADVLDLEHDDREAFILTVAGWQEDEDSQEEDEYSLSLIHI